jgi:predicted RNA-binding Zn-ribbon protein involved in translation (DUF1610 family)
MPTFDQHCTVCAWEAEIHAKPHEHPPCPTCGGVTERVWRASARVNGDEIPGGTWIENLGPEPMQFFAKSDIVREAKRRGLEPMVRHVPVPGTDKSPHTTSWDMPSQYTLDAAAALVARVTSVAVPEEPKPSAADLAVTEQVFAELEG